MERDTVKRSIVKTLFFKIVTTSVTAIFIGNIGKAILLHIILTVVYLIYERIWNKIEWGKKNINQSKIVSNGVLCYDKEGKLSTS